MEKIHIKNKTKEGRMFLMKNKRNKKQLIKTNNGITLIALVITIIVLIILY